MPGMRSSYRRRRWLSGWLAALVLFMQCATAAYACPNLDGAASVAAAMAEMADCTGDMPAMDPDQPQLCKAHCEADRQSVNTGAFVLDAAPVMAHGGALVWVIDVAQAAERAAAMPPTPGAGPPAGTPPLYLSLLVLRN